MLQHDPKNFTFRRKAEHRWIAAPLMLLCAWLCLRRAQGTDIVSTAIVSACFAIALGLWLPARWAIWPLRLIGLLLFAVFLAIMFGGNTAPAAQTPEWSELVFAWLDSAKGLVFVGLPGLWFALTGRVGWKAHHKPVIL